MPGIHHFSEKEGCRCPYCSAKLIPFIQDFVLSSGEVTNIDTFEKLLEALVTTAAPRKIYLSHMRMVVIGEEVAKDGIGEILAFLSRDHSMRSDFYLVVTRETKAEEALKVPTSIEIIPANKLYSSLEMSEQTWAPTHAVTIDELFPCQSIGAAAVSRAQKKTDLLMLEIIRVRSSFQLLKQNGKLQCN